MNKPKILVIGSIFMDLVWNGMPKLAQFGQSISCKGYAYVPGGKGANQAVAAAKLGAEAFMVGYLGNDENGRILIDSLKENDVRTNYTIMDSTTQSGLALMLIEETTGKYISYNVMGGNAKITEEQIAKALEEPNLAMILLNLEIPLECAYRTCEMAKEKGIPVFLDAGPAMSIPLERMKGLFIISPNETETKSLTGIEPDSDENIQKAAEKLYEMAEPTYVLLKLGERGAFLYDGKKGEVIPACKVKAIDSTAAGDTFGGAFAAAYCSGKDLKAAIRYAHAAAGLCVSRQGGQPSIPTGEEVDAFLML